MVFHLDAKPRIDQSNPDRLSTRPFGSPRLPKEIGARSTSAATHEKTSGDGFPPFGDLRRRSKRMSGPTIDSFLTDSMYVDGKRTYYIKNFLDHVPLSREDKRLAQNPEKVAELYSDNISVIFRNLKIFTSSGLSPVEKEKVKKEHLRFKRATINNTENTKNAIVRWCNAPTTDRTSKFPIDAIRFRGFNYQGVDIFDSDQKHPQIRPNFKIQRQIGDNFIMGYTDQRVLEMQASSKGRLDHRIYLNPEAMVVPQVFEMVFQKANALGLSLQIKILDSVAPFATRNKSRELDGGIRGDNIVIYTRHDDIDTVLKIVYEMAAQNWQHFQGRGVPRIPLKIADGIAVGDEPYKKRASLTSHRASILDETTSAIKKSGLQGEAARQEFQRVFRVICLREKVDPDNLAFNV